jgi:hypothetical protein
MNLAIIQPNLLVNYHAIVFERDQMRSVLIDTSAVDKLVLLQMTNKTIKVIW